MTFSVKRSIWLIVLVAVAAGTLPAQISTEPMVDNPQYLRWAPFDLGSWARRKFVVTVDGTDRAESITTATLTAIDEDQLVLTLEEVATTWDIGFPLARPTEKMDVPAKVPAGSAVVDDPEEVEEGEATIKVPAGTFKCKYTSKTSTYTYDGRTHVVIDTTWRCDKVPGGTVKWSMVSYDLPVGKTTTTFELLDYSTGGL